jgi:hypothetical protein
VLSELFDDDLLKNRKPEYVSLQDGPASYKSGSEYTEEEARDVEQRLKGMGYL